jgi:hypothetical protein
MITSQRIGRSALIMALLGVLGHSAAAQDSSKTTKKSTKKSTKTEAPSAQRKAPSAPRRPAATDSSPLWPVPNMPAPLPGAILPAKRIVAYYGNPLSKRMGILGEVDSATMLARLDSEVARWNKADPAHPVVPALHLIAVVASDQPGTSGKYRTRMDSAMIRRVYNWAKSRNALLFLDVQVGQGTLQEELPRLLPWLKNPDVHLGIDPEFSMKTKHVPGTKIGTYDADDVNYASSLLQELVTKEKLPPKVLVVHRFTRDMLTGHKRIKLDPRVQVVINMDGWGPPSQKRESYRAYVQQYPVEYTGFKLFYHNDEKKKGSRIMTPAEVLALFPKPMYIQYQ